ncbi:MAG: hypothetical protein QGF59_30440 [Pirellulaceae bacterium]|nr:hypothetical protein [Pirellulaceae bacterium]
MSNTTKRERLSEACAFVVLVALGVGLRLFFQDLPNFGPVAALALFSGYYFRNGLTALAVPLTVMAISDYFIGGYSWQVMVVVYASLALPVVLRGVLHRCVAFKRTGLTSAVVAIAGLMTCALGSSLMFYLTTNFAHWIWFGTDHTYFGLLYSYISALPFFRFTVFGDLLFAFALFGGHVLFALASRRHVVTMPANSPLPVS